jgi:serine/threonine protein kinase
MGDTPKSWVERWRRGEKIGEGGQGNTYHATRIDDGSITGVLKTLKNKSKEQPRLRLAREVLSLGTLADRGGEVPKILDDNTEGWKDSAVELYAVTEFIPGDTIEKYVTDRRKLSLDEALTLTLSIAQTLAIAHEQEVLHRDLKPSNVIVQAHDHTKATVIDLGLSFHADDEGVTQTGEKFRNDFLVLPEFISLGGDRHDRRSDLTQLCGLVYYMLTGHKPDALRDGARNKPHRRPGRTVRDVLAGDARLRPLEQLLDRGFEDSVDDRFSNASQIIAALKAVKDTSESIPATDPTAFAAGISTMLLSSSKRFRMRSYRDPANMALQSIHAVQQRFKNQAEFRVSASTTTQPGKNLPSGYVDLEAGTVTLQVSLDLVEDQFRGTFFAIGRAESVAIVVRTEMQRVKSHGMGGKTIVDVKDWPAREKELVTFDPTSKADAVDGLEEEVNRWLNQAIQELANRIPPME